MNSIQNARYKAYSLALAHLKENEAITKAVPAFETAFLSAKATLAAVDSADSRKAQKKGGVTDSKQKHQDNLANQALALAAVISSYAALNKDLVLKEEMHFSPSELFYGPNQQVSVHCANILAKARELTGELKDYGVTEALIDNYATQLDQYAVSILEPRSATAERKQAGELVAELLKQLQVIFTDHLDALMLLFKFTHRDFYNQYLIKRMIVNPATRKTRVEGVVTDKASRTQLANVSITVKGSNLEAATLGDGSYSLKTPALTMVTVVYQKEGYKPFTIEAAVKRGQATTLNVELEAA